MAARLRAFRAARALPRPEGSCTRLSHSRTHGASVADRIRSNEKIQRLHRESNPQPYDMA
jgi:hypothetical protein